MGDPVAVQAIFHPNNRRIGSLYRSSSLRHRRARASIHVTRPSFHPRIPDPIVHFQAPGRICRGIRCIFTPSRMDWGPVRLSTTAVPRGSDTPPRRERNLGVRPDHECAGYGKSHPGYLGSGRLDGWTFHGSTHSWL